MVTEDGLVKVLDFGLAKLENRRRGPWQVKRAGPAQRKLRPFLALQALRWERSHTCHPNKPAANPRTSALTFFLFGVLLFEMLARELPFTGENLLAMLHSLHFGAPKDIRYLRPDLPPAIASIVGRCLQKLPADRYQNAAEIARDLRRGETSGMAFAIGSTATSADRLQTTAQNSVPAQSVSSASVAQTTMKARRKWKREAGVALLVLLAALFAIPQVRHRISSLWEKPQPTSNAANVAVPDNPFALRTQAQAYLDRWDLADNLDRVHCASQSRLELDQAITRPHTPA